MPRRPEKVHRNRHQDAVKERYGEFRRIGMPFQQLLHIIHDLKTDLTYLVSSHLLYYARLSIAFNLGNNHGIYQLLASFNFPANGGQ